MAFLIKPSSYCLSAILVGQSDLVVWNIWYLENDKQVFFNFDFFSYIDSIVIIEYKFSWLVIF